MRSIAAIVLEPLVVDELSLIRAGPVRVQGRCRNPNAINGSQEVFFNGKGVFLRFEVENNNPRGAGGAGGPPSGPGKNDDKNDKDKDNHPKGDKLKKSMSKFDRLGKMDREAGSSHDGSLEEGEELKGETHAYEAIPIAAFHPDKGMFSPLPKLQEQLGGQR